MSTPSASQPPVPAVTSRGQYTALVIAFVGFAINFWAWALISPLAPTFKTALGLSSFQQAVIVAVPVIVGSLGRIPVGALTDRYGGRVMFPLVSFATIVPVLFLAVWHDSYAQLLVGGFFLGIGGTTFAIGIPFVNAWFPPERRGLALGIFGAGMGGTAISALTTVKLAQAHTIATPFVLVAVLLAVYGVVALLLARDAPGRTVPTIPFLTRLGGAMRLKVTWQLSALYALAFGGYVAFSVYLPTLLVNANDLVKADASNKMAGFVLVAVVCRPLGGWLSDRLHPIPVLVVTFAGITAMALVLAQALASDRVGVTGTETVAFLIMAGFLGLGTGSVFALLALLTPVEKVGGVTGVVGAAGGLGGFVPPLIMGYLYGHSTPPSYQLGLVALAVVAAVALVYVATVMRREAVARRPASA